MDKTPLLLFDLGGVLIENRTFPRLKALLDRPADEDTLKRRWLDSPAVSGFEHGRLTPAEFATEFLAEWNLQLAPGDFLEEFGGWPAWYYPGAREALRQLAGRHRLACLSNSNELHWARYDGFAEFFDPALSSHLLGVMKPDPRAFRLAVEHCGVPAGDILFFDDLPANVEAAREEGMRAFHVEGFRELEAVLRAEGLVTGSARSG